MWCCTQVRTVQQSQEQTHLEALYVLLPAVPADTLPAPAIPALLTLPRPTALTSLQNLARWAALLQTLSQVLMTNLAIARSEAAVALRAHLEDGMQAAVPPLLNLASANVIGLLIRCVRACGGKVQCRRR